MTRALSTRIKLSQGKQNKTKKGKIKGERETIVTMYTTNKNFKKKKKKNLQIELYRNSNPTQHNTNFIEFFLF